jgi:hypothetical protein
LYSYVDALCSEFGTCGPSANAVSGTSNIHWNIFAAFSRMKTELMNNCTEARAQKEIITKKLFIPLFQGMTKPDSLMRSITSAASVLPLDHFCNSTNAKTMLQNFIGTGNNPNCLSCKLVSVGRKL